VNPRHQLIVALAGLSPDARALKDDTVHLLFDEARVLDGDRPADAAALMQPFGSGAPPAQVFRWVRN
jgi:molecular chaperone HtpG